MILAKILAPQNLYKYLMNTFYKINRMDLKISYCTNVNIAELLGNIKCHWRIISALETLQAVEVFIVK